VVAAASCRVDCHSEGINFNEFIAAMFDAQELAFQQQQQLVRRLGAVMCDRARLRLDPGGQAATMVVPMVSIVFQHPGSDG